MRESTGSSSDCDAEAAAVIVVRRAVDLPSALSAPPGAAGFVFLHGEGVAASAELARHGSATANGAWRVCRTSWQRREPHAPPPAPFREATLVELFRRLKQPGRLICHGLGGSSAGTIGVGERLLIEIAHAPGPEHDRRETLEIALAAAALECDAVVLFGSGAAAHLCGRAGRGWRQLVEFDLLPLVVESDPPTLVPIAGVEPVTATTAARMRHQAAARLLL